MLTFDLNFSAIPLVFRPLTEKLKNAFNTLGQQTQKLQSPADVARQSVQKILDLAENGNYGILAMGEIHPMFSHQITQARALKEFVDRRQNVTLFMEYPHNRLYTVLLDKGYKQADASKLAEHIRGFDNNGHITAKALIGGNTPSLRGRNFAEFESQMLLQVALQHGIKIVYADAARVYPEDFRMDFSDPSTNETATKLNARRGPPDGDPGPDDMLIRNTHMAQSIKTNLEKSGGVGLLATGAAHCLGIDDANNGLHHYKDSLAKRFQEIGLPAVILSMPPEESLPPDYEPAGGKQVHMFSKPGPLTLIGDMSILDVHDHLVNNGFAPDLYDPRRFADSYKAEFDSILTQAEIELDVKRPASGLLSNPTVPI